MKVYRCTIQAYNHKIIIRSVCIYMHIYIFIHLYVHLSMYIYLRYIVVQFESIADRLVREQSCVKRERFPLRQLSFWSYPTGLFANAQKLTITNNKTKIIYIKNYTDDPKKHKTFFETFLEEKGIPFFNPSHK